MSVERQIVAAVDEDRATQAWADLFLVGAALDGPPEQRLARVTRWVRQWVLSCMGLALVHGLDGGELPKHARTSAEHRVGDQWLGARALQLVGEHRVPLYAVEWSEIAKLLDASRRPVTAP